MPLMDEAFEGAPVLVTGGYGFIGSNVVRLLVTLGPQHLDAWNAQRRRLARRYNRGLHGTGVKVPVERPDTTHVYCSYAIRRGIVRGSGSRSAASTPAFNTGDRSISSPLTGASVREREASPGLSRRRRRYCLSQSSPRLTSLRLASFVTGFAPLPPNRRNSRAPD
jgi:hypothetical protein